MSSRQDDFFSGLMWAIAASAVIGAVLIIGWFMIFLAPMYIGYRLYIDSPKRKERVAREHTIALYEAATRKLIGHQDFDLERHLGRHLPDWLPETVYRQLIAIGQDIFAAEDLTIDIPEPPPICNSLEGARYRDMLARVGQTRGDPKMSETAAHMISACLESVARFSTREEGEIHIPIVANIPDLNAAVESAILPFFQENEYFHFRTLRDQLDANFRATHRTNPVFPTEYTGKDVIGTYLAGTPCQYLFDVKVPFAIPERLRFEHTYMLGGTGHGKTTAVKYFLSKDIEEVIAGQKSVVVIDSQTELINQLARVDVPKERVVWIDPDDVAHPLALNLFAVGQQRFGTYSKLEQEQLLSSVIELYEFVLASLMDTGLTGQQRVLFRYCVRLMLEVPDATLLTLLDVLEQPDGCPGYAEHIQRLEPVPRRFFESQFDDNEFKRMRKAVTRRMYIILENTVFERMFSGAENKFDMFEEINAGKLIMINTSKATLKEDGVRVFGRFFLALLAQAAAERAMIPEHEKIPTICYLDEAHEYIDKNVNTILAQARKQRIGMFMAHQYLGQIRDNEVAKGLEANTSIKLAGGVSASDARGLAAQMNAEASDIQNQPTFHFMTYARGVTQRGLPIAFPPGSLEKLPTRYDFDELRAYQRATYAQSPKPDDPDDPPEGKRGLDGTGDGESGDEDGYDW
ncbi:MAG: ATP-binding protein [Pseudomonadota bacterium]